MLTGLRTTLHLLVASQHLRELTYAASDSQIRESLGADRRRIGRLAVEARWSPRTTASVLGALWIHRTTTMLDGERKMRVARAILEQEGNGVGPLDWFEEFSSGRLNAVGVDLVLMRYNLGRGTIASWIVERRRIEPQVLRVFTTMAAWGLADTPDAQVVPAFEQMMDDLRLDQ